MRNVVLFSCLTAGIGQVMAASALPKDGADKQTDRQRPNVIVILADDLGYGDLQCYGARNVATPNVNRLAKEGIRFTNAHAVAATSTPSRYSLL
ncbi:MAG: sulfatase-like hydrolase/transferase, partial [Bacteroidales bacterium]|nr:sulfatase-like hydrolase/transferase [Bacteroidales bacterium]